MTYIPTLPQQLFSEDQLQQMWDYMRYFVTLVNPFVMIGVSICIAAGVIGLIIYLMTRNNAKNDDDYDVEYY